MRVYILYVTGQPPMENELRKLQLQWFGHVQSREFSDVNQWGSKDNQGKPVYRVDTISGDISWIEGWTDAVTDR